jgi:hypothetical protein
MVYVPLIAVVTLQSEIFNVVLVNFIVLIIDLCVSAISVAVKARL